MSVALACTWRPRGEIDRLQQIHPLLEAVYDCLVVLVTSADDLPAAEPLRAWPTTTVIVSPERYWGRYVAVQTCLERPVSHIHYADLDMLVRWVEAEPVEWRETVAHIQRVECLITGRSERAFQSRPQAIQQTEAIINAIGSYFLGQPVDLGPGSRGFSRRAAGIVIRNGEPGGYGDLEWPILVKRAGLAVDYVVVSGVDWESADQYRQEAADAETRRQHAERYDQRPASWALRVRTARDIVDEGIAAMQRPLNGHA